MDVKEAARMAANYVFDMESMFANSSFEDTDPSSFMLERRFSIEGTYFNPDKSTWEIEVGFTRPWDRAKQSALAGISGNPVSAGDVRTYKRVMISDTDGQVISYGE